MWLYVIARLVHIIRKWPTDSDTARLASKAASNTEPNWVSRSLPVSRSSAVVHLGSPV